MPTSSSFHIIHGWRFPEIRGAFLGDPYTNDYSILGSVLGYPNFGKLPDLCSFSSSPGGPRDFDTPLPALHLHISVVTDAALPNSLNPGLLGNPKPLNPTTLYNPYVTPI